VVLGTNFWKIKTFELKNCTYFIHFSSCIFLTWLILESKNLIPFLAFLSALCIREIPRFFLSIKATQRTYFPLCLQTKFYATRLNSILFSLLGISFNFAIGCLLILFYQKINFNIEQFFPQLIASDSFLTSFTAWNFFLVFFHILPIFPFDGAVLSQICLKTSSSEKKLKKHFKREFLISILFLITLSLAEQTELFLLSFLFIFPSFIERAKTKLNLSAQKYTCKDAMFDINKMQLFPRCTTASKALDIMLKSPQTLFPVMQDEKVIGVLSREDVINGVFNLGDNYIGELIKYPIIKIQATTPLSSVIPLLKDPRHYIVIEENERHLGIISLTSVREFIIIKDTQRSIKETERFLDEEI